MYLILSLGNGNDDVNNVLEVSEGKRKGFGKDILQVVSGVLFPE